MNRTGAVDQEGRSIVLLMAALLVSIFAFQLNASMLSPALTTMEYELAMTPHQIAFSQTMFFTAAALFSLFLPRLANLAGRKRVLLGMLVTTMAGCVIAALASNLAVLILGRILQGVSGPVVPLCLIMLHEHVSDKRRYARLMAVLTSVNGGIGGIDAIMGGWLVHTWGFRSLFWTMALVCGIAIGMIVLFAQESHAKASNRMDWVGVAFLVVAVGAVLVGINEAEKLAAANWPIAACSVAVAVLAFAAFWRTEKRVLHPMVSTLYLKQRRTWALLSTTLLTLTGIFAIMNGIVPALAQDSVYGPGLSANVVSFATLTPYALAGLAFGPIAGVLASRFGYRIVLRSGLALSVAGVLFGLCVVDSPSIGMLVAMSVVVGVAYAGAANIMLGGLGIVLSPKDNTGYLPGLNAGAFNLGAGLSFALLYAVMSACARTGGVAAGYTGSLAAGAVLLLLALLMSLMIPDPEKVGC